MLTPLGGGRQANPLSPCDVLALQDHEIRGGEISATKKNQRGTSKKRVSNKTPASTASATISLQVVPTDSNRMELLRRLFFIVVGQTSRRSVPLPVY